MADMKKFKTIVTFTFFGLFLAAIAYIMNRPIEINEPNFSKALGRSCNCSYIEFKCELSQTKIEEIEKSELGDMAYVVRTKISKSLINKICEEFDIGENHETFGDYVRYGNHGENQLEVYYDGSFEIYSGSRSTEQMTIGNTACIAKATEILKKLGMPEEDFKYDGVFVTTAQNGGKEVTQIISRDILFKRIINNTDVYGNSQCRVGIGGDGEIQRIFMDFTDNFEEVDVEKRISVDSAIEAIKKNKGQIKVPKEADEVVITDVEIKYWEESDKSLRVIQPIYEFQGKAYKDGKEIGKFNALETLVKK